MEIQWKYNGNRMEIQWEYIRNTLEIQWKYNGQKLSLRHRSTIEECHQRFPEILRT